MQNDWCIKGQRVIIICRKELDALQSAKLLARSQTEIETYMNESNDFCLVGMVGIIDPPREGISNVINKCREAGIRVLMITGDYALTAAAIAAEIGIFTNAHFDTIEVVHERLKQLRMVSESVGAVVVNLSEFQLERDKIKGCSSLLLTGSDLVNVTEAEWRLITKYDEIVFARTSPEQKLRIVKEFQRDKYVVGVTGDGVNDAPALKSADIGIAMGSGSEVAMEASQLVLLDSNFSSMLIAIENGRLVFDNLRKVILYLLPAGSIGIII
jgi:sodium/potassium-transporting ATPase subunit alpha